MAAHLKSLELHGYKTFASRTVFEFPGAITAIVGPNGSGKSNIADAIRWVLGEQSYSLLRGKRTEDMIFAGSEQRSRSGMASATLVFDNLDQWLPIDFSEVAIARRAYRDGENEYLLNNHRVRLKDVSELLAQSGLVERTYTIIGQGLVDVALSLKAEERRRLFEDAAGISLHRLRREEALRRLDHTQRNLERVEDILAELEPRLRSLERQAQKAREYERVKDELRSILLEWYGYHWHRGQGELRQAKEVVRNHEANLKKAQKVEADYDRALGDLRKRILDLRSRLNDWHGQSASLHERRETINRDLAVADERHRALLKQQQDFNNELTRIEETIEVLQDRIDAAREEVEQIEIELIETRDQSEQARQAVENRTIERSLIEGELEGLRRGLDQLIQQQAELRTRLDERRTQHEKHQLSYQAGVSALSQAEKALQQAERAVAETQQTLSLLESSQKDAESNLEKHQQERNALDSKIREEHERISLEQAAMAKVRAELQVLDQAEKMLTGYASGARLLIEAARQNRILGTHGTVSNHLDVPEEFEVAIAAALGEYLDAILLESKGELDKAIAIFEGQTARGAILPMDQLSAGKVNLTWRDREEVLGFASDFVHTQKDFQAVVDLLLGRVLIVRDRTAAMKLLYDGNRIESDIEQDLRIVTLKGEVFHARGQVLVGLESKPATLSRPRQRQHLIDKLARSERTLNSIEQSIEALEKQVKEHERVGKYLLDVLRKVQQKTDKASIAHSQMFLKMENARQQVTWHSEQVRNLTGVIGQIEAELQVMTDNLLELDKEGLLIQESIKERADALSHLAVDELQDELARINLQVALTERSLSEAQLRWQERSHAFEEAQQRRSEGVHRFEQAREACKELDNEIAKLKRVESEVRKQIDDLQTKIHPAENDLDQADNDQFNLQAKEAQARSALNQAEHYHAQARIALAKRQEALETLRQRIEDDFGLVVFEYADEVTGPTPLPFEGMVEQLPVVSTLAPDTEDALRRQRALLRRMGPINLEAQTEYQTVKTRYNFMVEQVHDLKKAENDVRQVIVELDALMVREFQETFGKVADEFHHIFTRLFGGGTARLVMTDPEDLTNAGIEIEARLPGRREQGLSLLSGGERSLTAVALIFALLRVSPAPFCVLDEVDAMLDEANVGRYRDLLRELSQTTQFIIITHNRNSVQVADVIYGVTMGKDSTSQTISLKMDEIHRWGEAAQAG